MSAKIKSQKGFAAIEIILVMLIISMLSAVALPKMARMINIAKLDYETKKFISEFYFAKAVSRSSKYEPEIFSKLGNGYGIGFFVTNTKYEVRYSYEVIGDTHQLPKNFKITRRNLPATLSFDSGRNSNTGTYIFTSPNNISWYAKKNSVGKIHISRTD